MTVIALVLDVNREGEAVAIHLKTSVFLNGAKRNDSEAFRYIGKKIILYPSAMPQEDRFTYPLDCFGRSAPSQ